MGQSDLCRSHSGSRGSCGNADAVWDAIVLWAWDILMVGLGLVQGEGVRVHGTKERKGRTGGWEGLRGIN